MRGTVHGALWPQASEILRIHAALAKRAASRIDIVADIVII